MRIDMKYFQDAADRGGRSFCHGTGWPTARLVSGDRVEGAIK